MSWITKFPLCRCQELENICNVELSMLWIAYFDWCIWIFRNFIAWNLFQNRLNSHQIFKSGFLCMYDRNISLLKNHFTYIVHWNQARLYMHCPLESSETLMHCPLEYSEILHELSTGIKRDFLHQIKSVSTIFTAIGNRFCWKSDDLICIGCSLLFLEIWLAAYKEEAFSIYYKLTNRFNVIRPMKFRYRKWK